MASAVQTVCGQAYAIGQAEDIAAQGQILARGLIPQLFAFALNCPMQRFLQARYVSSGNGGWVF
ncbi:hypothetical protein AMTR_s00092p00084790 [Amborella trichopoda]|uniref:Uncharacterized protein n=1 Tax=Amborella trichopoda TaxID=13333 RepID=W1NWZ9_AMBTC|nr:hypothetical protein AMTR_s00092p00084790 [Amborella trichopoda]